MQTATKGLPMGRFSPGVRRVVGLATAVLLLSATGCGLVGDDEGEPQRTGAERRAEADAEQTPVPTVAYSGPTIEGVRAQPRWTADGVPKPPKGESTESTEDTEGSDSSDNSDDGGSAGADELTTEDLAARTKVLAVGDSFAVVKPDLGAGSQNSDDSENSNDSEEGIADSPLAHRKVELYDAQSGRHRGTIPDVVEAAESTWNGKPALLVAGIEGGITIYDSAGKQVTETDNGTLNVSDGWSVQIRREDGEVKEGLSLVGPDGSIKHEVKCEVGATYQCEFPSGFLGGPPQELVSESPEFTLPLALGPYGFSTEEIDDNPYDRKLAMHDLGTESKLWSSEEIERPKGVVDTDDVSYAVEALPLAAWDGKVVLAWLADDSGDSGDSDYESGYDSGDDDSEGARKVLAVHDAESGRLLSTGPTMSNPEEVITDPRHRMAVVSERASEDTPYPASAAWNLESGRQLWQENSGLGTAPRAIAAGVVYLEGEDGVTLGNALDARTGKPVSTDTSALYDAVEADNGYVAALTTSGLFVFPPKSKNGKGGN